jgi:hypothetical protein
MRANTERQRQFRERNPGYYARVHARRRAAASVPLVQLANIALANETRAEPLMLPAPAIMLEIPGMNMLRSSAEMRVAEAIER